MVLYLTQFLIFGWGWGGGGGGPLVGGTAKSCRKLQMRYLWKVKVEKNVIFGQKMTKNLDFSKNKN
jgi:hypothetical protein